MRSAHWLRCTCASSTATVINESSKRRAERERENGRRKRRSQSARKLMARGERKSEGERQRERERQSQTNSEGSMCRLLLAHPRECQTQSSSSRQFKVVTRPLEFLILIASTFPRLRWRQRTGREREKMWARAAKEQSGEVNYRVDFLPFISSGHACNISTPVTGKYSSPNPNPQDQGGDFPLDCICTFLPQGVYSTGSMRDV